MPTNKTQNYQLNQWVKSDQVKMEDFNADNAKIDAALAGKASASALSSLQSVVSGKASASALTALQDQVNSQAAALSKTGNCKIEVTSYTGNGIYGPSSPTAIQFSQRPTVFFVIAPITFAVLRGGASTGVVMYSSSLSDVNVAWSGATARLTTNNGMANWQLNANKTTYWVIALYDMS